MRIYEGSPRQDWEEVLRSVGAYLDDRGMRDIVFVEDEGGFILQGLTVEGAASTWGESLGTEKRVTLTVSDEDIARFMDEAAARRGKPKGDNPQRYELELRVIGRFIDGERPRDLFFFEQGGDYVLRLSHAGQAGTKHALYEFPRQDIANLVANAPDQRRGKAAAGSPAPAEAPPKQAG
jgi:hypothetical protein